MRLDNCMLGSSFWAQQNIPTELKVTSRITSIIIRLSMVISAHRTSEIGRVFIAPSVRSIISKNECAVSKIIHMKLHLYSDC
jgi:hypothetical protein